VLNLLVVLVFLLAAGITPRPSWLLLPLVIVPLLVVLTTAAAMILSSLYPRFRDIGIAWTVLSTALFYATPVIYALGNGHISSRLQQFVMLNPFASILELSRRWVIDPSAPTPAALAHAWLIVPVLIYVGVCVLAVWVFRREAPRIAEAL
jgi:ABC-2 type transport system permease protein